ncbi:hypothetical protein Elgi_04540 [Paenibacillus elgii]|uniref:hypothetical protein n=1 Tax=Paenibacillus elgii TaxID=189691 RepID=UPI002D7A72A8|nr:hypothetical protein Elgi_04540 [Paenibacillus elgii]
MIQIVEISPVKEENVEIDEYIPIDVKWGANERAFGKNCIGEQEIFKNHYLRWVFLKSMEALYLLL